jgi:hypothetical protein
LSQHRKIETKSVVGNYRLVFDKRFNQMPDFIESGRISGHFGSNVVDAGKPVPVEVIGWLHQNAEFIGNSPFSTRTSPTWQMLQRLP